MPDLGVASQPRMVYIIVVVSWERTIAGCSGAQQTMHHRVYSGHGVARVSQLVVGTQGLMP